ncbi:zinc finger, CCHC-type containing protein [Tanacetum coccineum]
MAAAAMKHMASNFTKLDKFEGVNFRRWQKKKHFLLSRMSVVYVLTTPIPEDGENAIMELIRKRNKWDNDDYVYKGLILNGIYDSLFDIYQNVESFKELWDFLEAKYMTKDASSKKFLVYYVTYVYEAYFVQDDDVAWWVNSGAIVHVCKEAINDEMDSIMGNGVGSRLQTSWLQMDLQKKNEVARISTIRLLIALALIHNLIIHQMNVKTTFLNGELDEEVYMNQPQGFIMPGNENKCCYISKGLCQMYNGKSIHLGVMYNMIRELIMNGVVSIEFVRSQQNLADYLTNGLAGDLVLKSTEGMGLKSN